MSKLLKRLSVIASAPFHTKEIKRVYLDGEIQRIRREQADYPELDPNDMVKPGDPIPSRNMATYSNNDPIEKFVKNSKKGGKRRTYAKRTNKRRTRKH